MTSELFESSTPSQFPPYQGGEQVGVEYENQDLVIVNKPAGLPVYSTKKCKAEESVLLWFLKKYPAARHIGDLERPGVVHRLDKQTSGLLVLAKTQAGYDFLSKIFRSRNITKEYLALVYGELPKHGVVEKPLTKIGHEGQSRVRVDEKGKMALTEYWAIGYYNVTLPWRGESTRRKDLPKGERAGEVANNIDTFTLVRVKLHTGRTHQIRVHFASERHPVMGDNLYGKPNSLKLKEILLRQFLHASRIEFQLRDGTWLEVESELPSDLKKILDQLNKITT